MINSLTNTVLSNSFRFKDPLSQIEERVLDLRPDPSTMYVDLAGTQPASVGDPVGRWEDQSRQGNHAYQETQSAKPTLMQRPDRSYYLDFDGVDDYLQTPEGNMPEMYDFSFFISVAYNNWEQDVRSQYAAILDGTNNNSTLDFGIEGGNLKHWRGTTAGNVMNNYSLSGMNEGFYDITFVQRDLQENDLGVQYYVDGVEVDTASGGWKEEVLGNAMTVGAQLVSKDNISQHLSGQIDHIFLVNQNFSDSKRQQVEAAL